MIIFKGKQSEEKKKNKQENPKLKQQIVACYVDYAFQVLAFHLEPQRGKNPLRKRS